MENLSFDETREQDYSPATGLWMDQWDNDPTVWQEPMAETPYPWTLSQKYDQEYRQTDTTTLVDVVMDRPMFQTASREFRSYLEAIVVAKQMQVAPDRLMVIEDQEFRQLPMTVQYQVAQQLQDLVQTVFDWMLEQGMDPIPGTRQCPRLFTQDQAQRILDEF
jgi:hypothetical protein